MILLPGQADERGYDAPAPSHPLVVRIVAELEQGGTMSVDVWRTFFRTVSSLPDHDLLAIVDAMDKHRVTSGWPAPSLRPDLWAAPHDWQA
jgi:hypothetical protein